MEKQKNLNLIVFKLGGILFTYIGILRQLYQSAVRFSKDIFGEESFKILFVCSATAGTTKELIALYEAAKKGDIKERDRLFKVLKEKHSNLIRKIFLSTSIDTVEDEIRTIFESLEKEFSNPTYPGIVKFGELISSRIFSLLLEDSGNANQLFDARECIYTYGSLQNAKVNLFQSERCTRESMAGRINHHDTFTTQTFICQDYNKNVTSILPLNAGDLSAAIFACAMNAQYMVFLKDKPGVLIDENGSTEDPCNIIPEMTYLEYCKMFKNKERYPVYQEAIELLGRQHIPTRICSFFNLKALGTEIRA